MRKQSSTEKNITPPIKADAPWRISDVKVQADFCLLVTFNDGSKGVVDMKRLINSPDAGVFASLKDFSVFSQVQLIHGVTTWPGDIDLAPDAMHEAISQTGNWTP